MGCASSKLFRKDLKQELVFGNGGDCSNHVVNLTSSTYGVLRLDKDQQQEEEDSKIRGFVKESNNSPSREDPEVINAWELMEDLEEELPSSVQSKKSPKSRVFLGKSADMDSRSPLKLLNQMGSSPRNFKKFGGKENRGRGNGNGNNSGSGPFDISPMRVLKSCNLTDNLRKLSPKLRILTKGSPVGKGKGDCLRIDSEVSSGRRSLNPMFYPELVASFEKELSEEKQQIKKMVFMTPTSQNARISRDSESILESLEKKCPPGGENSVVFYSTTLRGIRKTFDNCNAARSIIESHHVQMFERDVSMHSAFKEELRGLMGTKKVKVPLVFVKGWMIGGADELMRLEEEGKLGNLFCGIPRAVRGCQGCAGIRFVMCMDCNGSCKVLGEDGKKTVRCGECNENGLIQCPICC